MWDIALEGVALSSKMYYMPIVKCYTLYSFETIYALAVLAL